jgi:hypothetical protein
MAIERARVVKGALAGALAAGVWAAQQPLDKRVFESDYDDVELLGKAVTTGPGWYPAGMAIHIGNGAAFGAVYSVVAPYMPVPAWARAPLIVMAENFGGWPLGRVVDRVHPARDELPALAGNRRALWQATWRHLLFGVVMGELERRLNPPEEEALPDFEAVVSSNGHGDIEQAVAAAVAADQGTSGDGA